MTPLPADPTLTRYLDEVRAHPLLTRAEEHRLARLAAGGDADATRRLIEANLRLVVAVARRYRGLGVELLDLIQEGNLGLVTAVGKYDWRRGGAFAPYAKLWIRQAICRAISTKSRTVRLPMRLAQVVTTVRRAERELTQELGHRPSLAQVAGRAAVDEDVVADVRRAEIRPVSLAEPVGEDATLADLLSDDGVADPAARLAAGADGDRVLAVFRTLCERHRRVLELRYGLDGAGARTLREVAGELGVSHERVRQIERHALHKLAGHPDLRELRAA